MAKKKRKDRISDQQRESAVRLIRLLEPGFPLPDEGRLVDELASRRIAPVISQGVIEAHDKGSDRFARISDSAGDRQARVRAVLQRFLREGKVGRRPRRSGQMHFRE